MRRALRTLVLTLALLGAVSGAQLISPAPSIADPSKLPICSDPACASVPATAKDAASVLVAMYGTGQLQIDESVWGGPSIYSRELLPISQGTAASECVVDMRTLQEIVIVARKYGSVKISDLNRRCADGTPRCDITVNGVAPTPNSPHCAALPNAVDYVAIGGETTSGGDAGSTKLVSFADTFVPYGSAAGQRTSCNPPYADLKNFTYFFDDGCNHQHIDLRYTNGTALNVPSGSAAPAFPALRSSFTIAYQTSAGTLNTVTSSLQISNWARAMAANSSPSIAYLPNESWQLAYIGSDQTLWTLNSAGQLAHPAMAVAQGTSPSIAVLPNGKWVVGFIGSAGLLYTLDSDGNVQNLGHYTAPNTSPSVAALPDSSWVIAYQNQNGTLSLETSSLQISNYGIYMAAGSSPSVTGLTNGTFALSYVGSDGALYVVNNAGQVSKFGHSIAGSTSPSITAMPNSEFVVSYQNANCTVSAETSSLQISNFNVCMAPKSSPSVRMTSTGRFFVAFVTNTNLLYVVDSASNLSNFGRPIAVNASQTMVSTSPSVN